MEVGWSLIFHAYKSIYPPQIAAVLFRSDEKDADGAKLADGSESKKGAGGTFMQDGYIKQRVHHEERLASRRGSVCDLTEDAYKASCDGGGRANNAVCDNDTSYFNGYLANSSLVRFILYTSFSI